MGFILPNMRILKIVLFFALTAAGFAQGALEYSGYADFGTGIRVVLTDLRSGSSSQWLKVGDVFQEHKLVAIDLNRDVVMLERGLSTQELPLKGTEIKKSILRRAEARTKVLVRSREDVDPAIVAGFITESVGAEFRTEILKRPSGRWSDLISAEISRPTPNSIVMLISVVALSSEAALGASDLLVRALTEKAKAHPESDLGIAMVQRPTLVKTNNAP